MVLFYSNRPNEFVIIYILKVVEFVYNNVQQMVLKFVSI